MDFNFFIVLLSQWSFLKVVVININFTIFQKDMSHKVIMFIALYWLVDSDLKNVL